MTYQSTLRKKKQEEGVGNSNERGDKRYKPVRSAGRKFQGEGVGAKHVQTCTPVLDGITQRKNRGGEFESKKEGRLELPKNQRVFPY